MTYQRRLVLLGMVLTGFLMFCDVDKAISADPPSAWPPKADTPYPDISFQDADGKTLKMSDFKGRPVVIHYVGMTCPACNGNARHRKMDFERYSNGVPLEDPRFIDITVLLFNDQMKPPQPADAKLWAERYPRNDASRDLILVLPAWVHDQAHYNTSYRMVKGTQLLDAKGIVRASVVTEYDGQKTLKHYWPDLVAMLAQWLGVGGQS